MGEGVRGWGLDMSRGQDGHRSCGREVVRSWPGPFDVSSVIRDTGIVFISFLQTSI